MTKKTKKNLKKLDGITMALVVWFFIIGASVGWFSVKFLTKNDCFELVGTTSIQLEVGEKYTDEGVNIIAFGQDAKSTVSCSTNMKVNSNGEYYADAVGEYYIIYTSSHIKYSSVEKIQKIRYITYVEKGEDNG